MEARRQLAIDLEVAGLRKNDSLEAKVRACWLNDGSVLGVRRSLRQLYQPVVEPG